VSARLDHIMVAHRDLHEVIEIVKAGTGVTAAIGGAHPGQGTWNALASFGDGTYLELIAPDPEQSERPLGDQFLDLAEPTVVTFIARVSDKDTQADALRAAGFEAAVLPLSRKTPAGDLLEWHMVQTTGHGIDPVMPMFIDWGAMPHPADTQPRGLTLERFTVFTDRPEAVTAVYAAAGLGGVDVRPADAPTYEALISGPGGSMALPGRPLSPRL
jgi:hypothetical protein